MDGAVRGDACKSPRRLPKKKSSHYSSFMLYDGKLVSEKLEGITIATCNPSNEDDDKLKESDAVFSHHHRHHRKKHVVSEKMSCNYCVIEFFSRHEQKGHYKSDWHRYNLKMRMKGTKSVTEEDFEKIAGDVSSISGSEDESELSDTDTDTGGGRAKSKPISIPQHMRSTSAHSGTDSESEGGLTLEGTARKYPKVYFKNKDGELISVFRCLLYHKKKPPSTQPELVTLTTNLPRKTKWAVCMTAGGHFAAAVFDGETIVAHKTFHRYVVRAKRGSAQSSRDSQGGMPKSAGASLRRYNEAALAQDVQELLSSWSEHLKKCDLIFLRAPSFNRQMFYGNKNPPFKKDDLRIRTIPFPTRRPTLNEVKRVHQMLASVECYGEAADIQDFVPMSPLRHFSPETGKLEIVSEDALHRSPRKSKDKELSSSPLASSPKQLSGSPSNRKTGKLILPDHLLVDDNLPSSSATSTASEADLVEMEEVISTLDLNQFESSPIRKKYRKKKTKKRRPSLKHQIEPDGDVYVRLSNCKHIDIHKALDEERYHLRNALYTACKVGDKSSLRDLLAILSHPGANMDSPAVDSEPVKTDSRDTQEGQTGEAESRVGKAIEGQGVLKMESLDSLKQDGFHGAGEIQGPGVRTEADVGTLKSGTGSLEEDGETGMGNVGVGPGAPQILLSTDDDRNISLSSETADIKERHTAEGDSENKSKTETPGKSSESEMVTQNDEVKLSKTSVESKEVTATSEPASQGTMSEAQRNGESTPGNQVTEKTATKPDGLPGLLSGLSIDSTKPNFELSPLVTVDVLNEPFGDNETTLLHVTSKAGHNSLVRLLLKAGSDPTVKDKFGKVPFHVAVNKETRNEFRKFMGEFPDKYDYTKAQIPSALTAEMEEEKRAKESERKKKQRKAKQERMKEKLEEDVKVKAEEYEKKRFLSLSDRDKRALAAERRLVQQQENTGAAPIVSSRCWQCAGNMTGKVPFEYSDFKFCSSKCLQLHRKAAKS